jgi:hypothetical protein
MIKPFLHRFNITSQESIVEQGKDFYKNIPTEFFVLLDQCGGVTLNKGLYRIHSFESSIKWAFKIGEYFDQYRHRIYPFGFDWMGRQFCLSTTDDILYMFDPAAGQVFELRQTLLLLHNDDFVNNTDDMLSVNLFYKVLSFYSMSSIAYNQCLGYKIPLFLGGRDEIDNYNLQDIEVYWHIESELYKKAKYLPEGTAVKNIKIE